MKEPTTKKLIFRKARKLILKLVVLAVLLSATGVVHATTGYFWGYLSNGDTVWLWCGQGGNYWTRCDTGSCPPGESCPCYACDTSLCAETADYYCDLLAN